MKKYFWIAALIAALAFVMAGCNVGVVGEGGGGGEEGGETIIIDLESEFTAVNNDTQKGWSTNGMDDKVTTLKIADLKAAKYLVLELAAAPSGGMQLIWQGDGNSYAWDSQDGILNDDGTANAAKGAKFRGESRAADNTVLEIELSKAMKNYNALKASTKAKFFIGYYSPDIAGLGITKAYLEIIKGGAPPPPATVTSVTVTPAMATIEQGATRQYTAAVEGENNPKNTVRWTISGQIKPGTTLSAAGLLTVAADEPVDTEITVTATSTVDKTKSGYVVVTVVEPEVVSSNFFVLGEFDDGSKSWFTNGVDGADNDLTMDILKEAKFFIAKMHADSLGGSGGLQFNIQGSGTSWDVKQNEFVEGGWVNIGVGNWGDTDVTFYIVVNLSALNDWGDLIDGSGAKIILNWPAGWSDSNYDFVKGYFSKINLTKPGTLTTDLEKGGTIYGWFAKTVPEMED